ncbi:hypothetical protein Sspor_16690 [Streptomyces spororaveus]|uniref:Uncharacterized protein n=1 Tax=Streptomyces spororaveus TaxID=284039 RepID=A0ABQ3T6T8_9ACTN|nr:hypothetical protein Sspor_16690 [Streptomyces spororaveus]
MDVDELDRWGARVAEWAAPEESVLALGSGQVSGLVKRNSGPCLGGRPLTPCIRGGFGGRMTRSERTRPPRRCPVPR